MSGGRFHSIGDFHANLSRYRSWYTVYQITELPDGSRILKYCGDDVGYYDAPRELLVLSEAFLLRHPGLRGAGEFTPQHATEFKGGIDDLNIRKSFY